VGGELRIKHGCSLHDRSDSDDAIDAIRALRSTLHGFVALESGGGFGLNVDIDRSFERLVRGITIALASWTDPKARLVENPCR
jgi:hypothetical protein